LLHKDYLGQVSRPVLGRVTTGYAIDLSKWEMLWKTKSSSTSVFIREIFDGSWKPYGRMSAIARKNSINHSDRSERCK
jgi:hypothetical protein